MLTSKIYLFTRRIPFKEYFLDRQRMVLHIYDTPEGLYFPVYSLKLVVYMSDVLLLVVELFSLTLGFLDV